MRRKFRYFEDMHAEQSLDVHQGLGPWLHLNLMSSPAPAAPKERPTEQKACRES